MAKCFRTGKECFPNRLEADIARANIDKNAVHHRHMEYRELPTRSYCCEFCKQWHLTSSPQRNESRNYL